MNIKLEELRKRLLEPVITPVGPSADRYRRSSRELYADQPRSAEPGDSASDRRLPSAEAVVFWGNQRRIGQDPPRAADQLPIRLSQTTRLPIRNRPEMRWPLNLH